MEGDKLYIVIGGNPIIDRIGNPIVHMGVVPRTFSAGWPHGVIVVSHEVFCAREISLVVRVGARCSSTFWRRLDDGRGRWEVGDIAALALKVFIRVFLNTRFKDLPQVLCVIDIVAHPSCGVFRTCQPQTGIQLLATQPCHFLMIQLYVVCREDVHEKKERIARG